MTTQGTAQLGEAGRRGKDVRGDCWVRIVLTQSGGIQLDLRSKVESMYGESIRTLVAEVLAGLGVADAKVELEDAGALPFVIMARVECVVRRLGVDVGDGFVPDFATGTEYGTEPERFRRTRLYLPGNQPKFLLNAGLHKPDGVILDLEDSVPPPEKDAARLIVRNALRSVDFNGCERMVRINQGETGLADLDYIVPHNMHLVLIPKVESAEQVTQVDARIQEIQGAAGFSLRDASSGKSAIRPVYLMPIVESALGAIRAYEIASASPNVVALTIGLEDYSADIGAEPTEEGLESFWARSQVVNAARAAGVQPIDSVFADVVDVDGLRASALRAKALGFEGKGCIHPGQIAVVREVFAPTASELENARKIVAAFDEAQAKGLAVVSLGSKMIDPPIVKRAQRVVRLARQMALID